ncbi:hypothetical protein EWM64_g4142 [Hericium alpestre]|uniref:EF-hand domain-containing protein n=1 Tax=Hericium alpestre TaxID=135208 RepID=A0A4Z0A2E9_9AGAM|nr:hypothetical protein EWM64_g4142 [Hericium alpestre]
MAPVWTMSHGRSITFRPNSDGAKHAEPDGDVGVVRGQQLTPEKARRMGAAYTQELLGRCQPDEASAEHQAGRVGWKQFKDYAEAKEVELWKVFHDELDLDGNGHLDAEELGFALQKAGVELSPSTLSDFMTYLTSSPHSRGISFAEFRDFLLLLPRNVSTAEIYRFYEVRKFLGDDGRGAARVTMEGDVSLSAEDKPPDYVFQVPTTNPPIPVDNEKLEYDEEEEEEEEEEGIGEEQPGWLEGQTALKFLTAGGIAGAGKFPSETSRSRAATKTANNLGGTSLSPKANVRGVQAIAAAVKTLYAEGGIRSFWVGNGLSVTKIFPESAIKFLTYESAKRVFAQYVDKVEDPREISGTSRFLSGGMGGIASQLCMHTFLLFCSHLTDPLPSAIYPIETLKTQMMSSTGEPNRSLPAAAKRLWKLGGFRAYYRGLGIGLIGVFPYSAIDMSTFEALKLAYLRSTGKTEPGVLAVLAFGSVSGSVGATSVYPLNLVRTRLQASGSPGHPIRYTGFTDVVVKTYDRDGWRGFYRGLLPTLAKVVPAVSISYVVYEHTKRKLGV